MLRTTFQFLMVAAGFSLRISHSLMGVTSLRLIRNLKVAVAPIAATYCLLLLLSCRELPESKYEEKLVVYSVLNPDFPAQFVLVDKTYAVDEEIIDSFGLSGCKVKVWKDGTEDTAFFQEIDTLPGTYFYIPSEWLEPMLTYWLCVECKGHTLSAHTTMPDTFSILEPKDMDTVILPESRPLVWSKSDGAAIYIVWPLFVGDTTLPLAPLATMDTAIDLFSYEETYFDSIGWYTIKVFAHDTNRYEYGRRPPSVPDTLDGGYGLFGSETMDTITLYITK